MASVTRPDADAIRPLTPPDPPVSVHGMKTISSVPTRRCFNELARAVLEGAVGRAGDWTSGHGRATWETTQPFLAVLPQENLAGAGLPEWACGVSTGVAGPATGRSFGAGNLNSIGLDPHHSRNDNQLINNALCSDAAGFVAVGHPKPLQARPRPGSRQT